MDQLILAEKIESLRRCIKRIEDKKPESVDLLMQNLDLQDILALNLTRAVQLSVDIGSRIISKIGELAPQTIVDEICKHSLAGFHRFS
jgi:uncharacterized protein YutE (UPF0331/DUF86 family)